MGASGYTAASGRDMFRRWFRILALVVANSVVTVLGLLLSVIGVWMRDKGQDYYDMFNPKTTEINQLPVLLIVVGGLIFFVGIVGILGGVLSKTVGGRIVLGMYGFILAFLIVCEIAAGIAGAVSLKKFDKTVNKDLKETFDEYYNPTCKIKKSWDSAQEQFHCCGYVNFMDYSTVFHNNSLPESCCNNTAVSQSSYPNCSAVVTDFFPRNNSQDLHYIYLQNCTVPVEHFFARDFRAIAGVAITFGILQIIGVFISCVAALPQKDPRDEFEPL